MHSRVHAALIRESIEVRAPSRAEESQPSTRLEDRYALTNDETDKVVSDQGQTFP